MYIYIIYKSGFYYSKVLHNVRSLYQRYNITCVFSKYRLSYLVGDFHRSFANVCSNASVLPQRRRITPRSVYLLLRVSQLLSRVYHDCTERKCKVRCDVHCKTPNMMKYTETSTSSSSSTFEQNSKSAEEVIEKTPASSAKDGNISLTRLWELVVRSKKIPGKQMLIRTASFKINKNDNRIHYISIVDNNINIYDFFTLMK